MDWGGVTGLLRDLSSVIWPRVCEMCGVTLVDGERHICLGCLTSLPRVKVHTDPFNSIHQRLASLTPIERAASLYYYYPQTPSARLIQKCKYNGLPALGTYLGELLARETAPDGFFDGIDLIVPVPLHWTRRMSRGYNQSLEIARGISSVTGIPVEERLVCKRRHSSQTRKGSYDRWANARETYAAADVADLAGKHVLIVDDIITTGATVLACVEAMHAASPSSLVSVASIGLTHER